MSYYTFNQNNSFGYFVEEPQNGIGSIVIIEAKSAEDAVERAEKAGIYFNGCDKGIDCPCCGDRWSDYIDETDAYEVPTVYGRSVYEEAKGMFRQDAFIHKIDGTIEHVIFK